MVFHKDLIAYLPDSSKYKVNEASFGNYKEFIEKQTEINSKVSYFKKIITPSEDELKKHKEYLKNNLKKNYFN